MVQDFVVRKAIDSSMDDEIPGVTLLPLKESFLPGTVVRYQRNPNRRDNGCERETLDGTD